MIGTLSDNGKDRKSGSVSVFVQADTSSWICTYQAKVLALDGKSEDKFGYTVSINNDTITVGSHYSDATKGSAYVFDTFE